MWVTTKQDARDDRIGIVSRPAGTRLYSLHASDLPDRHYWLQGSLDYLTRSCDVFRAA